MGFWNDYHKTPVSQIDLKRSKEFISNESLNSFGTDSKNFFEL
jgi:hypothetical protein